MGLNATVTPGITVTSSTVLSAANLNLIATPTVSITGSIDSSDIGANTVGTSELIDNAVTQAKIGAIGGANYILRGDSSGNAEGITTLAQDDNSENQISLLVNDTTELKPRVITGNLEVTTSGNNKINFAIKESSVTNAMLADGATSANISNIQPGGGLSAVGGKASVTNGGSGLIIFDPGQTGTIGGTAYYGKATVLQPTRSNQVLKSTGGATSALTFGSVPGVPDAFVHAYTPVYRGFYSTNEADIFIKLFGANVFGIRRESGLAGMAGYGVLLVVFEEGLFDSGDSVGVMGNGINSDYAHAGAMPFVHSSVAVGRFDGDLQPTTNTDFAERPYVYVKWFLNTPGSGTIGVNGVTAMQDQLQTGNGQPYLRGVDVCNMSFYKY